jgi:hypothetical protein
MPRASKTTVLKSIEKEINSIITRHKGFEIDPYPQTDVYNYDMWYLDHIIHEVEKVNKKREININ